MRRSVRITPVVNLHLCPPAPLVGPSSAQKADRNNQEALHGISNSPPTMYSPATPAEGSISPAQETGPEAGPSFDRPKIVIPPRTYAELASDSPVSDEGDAPSRPFVPGPFLRICSLHKGSHGRTEAVRDMKGGREIRGRVLCVKIFDKPVRTSALDRELEAYMTLSQAVCRSGENWLPYVMRLEASMENLNSAFFLMEVMYCDLQEAISHWDRGLRDTHKTQWVAQIVTGMDAIHKAGVIHRDLKPENIFVDFRFNIRIGDFGCSYMEPNGRAIKHLGGYDEDICGTRAYTAPEMADNMDRERGQGYRYSLEVDYWALGCIVFELEREGRGPALFENQSDLYFYRHYLATNVTGLSYFAFAGLNWHAESLVSGLLHPSPIHRYTYNECRRHPYFSWDDGYNEFTRIEERGAAINDLPVGADIPRDQFERDGRGGTTIYSLFLRDFREIGENYSWINPFGIWGTENNEINCY